MSVRVKICGITSIDDAQAAVEAGADALGFMFYKPSPRYLTPEEAGAIIRNTATTAGLDTLQFHGNEPPDFCTQFELRTIKAFRVKDGESLGQLADYRTDAWLLDSYVQGALGGTGERFNWDLALTAKRLGHPILLAGGLTPDNAGEAVEQVVPFGLDVSSGVEAAPGRKDAAKVTTLIANAKGCSTADGLWTEY